MPLGMLGKYERLDVLGHGVSGIVYLAKDTLLNRQVALKEVDVQAGDLRRFLEEARVMDRLRHPNIVRVNGVDRIDGKVIIDMEYVRGQNLQELLRVEGHLPTDRALDIAIQVLDALDYAHKMQTVHRDIKPANILISRAGEVKLVDFGLAEILATNAYAGGAGTYAYMAPEDFAEEDRSDSQSDIWAVGVTLYEMLTGHRPFQVTKVKDPFAWKRALETEAPTPLAHYLPDASPALQAILSRALARNKNSRYQTAGEFRDDLLRLRAGENLAAATVKLRNDGVTGRLQPNYDLSRGSNGRTPPVVPNLPHAGPGLVVADVTADPDSIRPVAPAGHGNRSTLTGNGIGADPIVPASPTSPLASRARKDAPESDELATVAAKPVRKRSRLPFTGRKETRVAVDPDSVDFGSVRKGELRTVKLLARVYGVEGKVEGRVLHTPGWLTVHPPAFDRARQSITLTAHSGRTWETGEFTETVRVETQAGSTEIPVRMVVLQPRPTFLQVASWYIPLFIAALLPALTVAATGGPELSTRAASLVPTVAIASGLLATMLLLISVAADLGMAERVACGVLMAVMCFVLGVSAAHPGHNYLMSQAMEPAMVTGFLLGAVLLLQLVTLSRWRLWAVMLGLLGLLLGGTFLHALLT